ncbi:MAG: rod-binding protein [Thermodesulfobacteriota bacterium]
MVTGISGNTVETEAAPSAYEQRLGKACEEFESIFISYMLKSAGSASAENENSLFGKRDEAAIIRSMFNDNLARSIAEGGGIGLATMLLEQLRG